MKPRQSTQDYRGFIAATDLLLRCSRCEPICKCLRIRRPHPGHVVPANSYFQIVVLAERDGEHRIFCAGSSQIAL